MNSFNQQDIVKYINHNIDTFHNKRVEKLTSLKLMNVLRRKNPYLFKAKNINTSHEIVQKLLDAHLSSQEETIFGNFLEGLAIYINSKVYKGQKSGITGIDLEFSKENVRYIVSIKSGPNWGNSSQISKMKLNFITAKKVIRANDSSIIVECINGCCYGKDNKPDKGSYFKFCGQKFWEFVSGFPGLYTDIIEPLGYKAKEKNDVFMVTYSSILNRFTLEFSQSFCKEDGQINWKELVRYNSENQLNK
jgi:hypothetical protein